MLIILHEHECVINKCVYIKVKDEVHKYILASALSSTTPPFLSVMDYRSRASSCSREPQLISLFDRYISLPDLVAAVLCEC
jgi:hypothetical protein